MNENKITLRQIVIGCIIGAFLIYHYVNRQSHNYNNISIDSNRSLQK
jgi:hypothetical protein